MCLSSTPNAIALGMTATKRKCDIIEHKRLTSTYKLCTSLSLPLSHTHIQTLHSLKHEHLVDYTTSNRIRTLKTMERQRVPKTFCSSGRSHSQRSAFEVNAMFYIVAGILMAALAVLPAKFGYIVSIESLPMYAQNIMCTRIVLKIYNMH